MPNIGFDDDELSSLMPSASPLASAGIDPQHAVANREQVLGQLAAQRAGLVHPVAQTSGQVAQNAPPPSPPAANAPNPPAEAPKPTAVPASVTPSGNAAPAAPNYYQQGQAGALQSAQAGAANASRFQNRPLPSATTDPIEAARLKAMQPTVAYGADGKLLSQYRPTPGQRVARGEQGFFRAGIPGLIDPALGGGTAYGAPNGRFQRDEAARQGTLAALTDQLKYRQTTNTADQGQLKDVGAADTAAGSQFGSVAQRATSQQQADTAAAGDWKAEPTVQGMHGEPVEVNSKTGEFRLGSTSIQPAKQPKPNTPEQQYLDEFSRMHPGSTVADAERQYTLDTQRPPQVAPVLMMVPGANGSSTAQVVRPGQTVTPGSMSASQFGAGNAADVKQGKAEDAAAANMDSELGLMKQFAANPSPTNDAAMLMHYIGATKPESMGKIRLNDRELKLFGGTRSSLGDAEALLTKVANGQSLTPDQRKDMVDTMTMISGAAKRSGHGSGAGAGHTDPLGIR